MQDLARTPLGPVVAAGVLLLLSAILSAGMAKCCKCRLWQVAVSDACGRGARTSAVVRAGLFVLKWFFAGLIVFATVGVLLHLREAGAFERFATSPCSSSRR
jgi:hypothetical protein